MKLVNYSPPYPDELLLSSFLRNLKDNALDPLSFSKIYLDTDRLNYYNLPLELRKLATVYFQALNMDCNIGNELMANSTLPFSLIFMTQEKQTEYMNLFFYDLGNLRTAPKPLMSTIKVCPICIQEDRKEYGEAYYHRCHQLEGVSVCAMHHVPLRKFETEKNRKEKICSFDVDTCVSIVDELPMPDKIAYAEYARQLLINPVCSDNDKIRMTIQEELSNRGYHIENRKSPFYADIKNWVHKSLFEDSILKYRLWLMEYRRIRTKAILILMMYLFPNQVDLVKRIDTGKQPINEYVCSSGHKYYATPYAHDMGWGCPECDKSMTKIDWYRRTVEKVGNGEYFVLPSSHAEWENIEIKHRNCYFDSNYKPRDFLYERQRCDCYKNQNNKNGFHWCVSVGQK